MYAETNVSRDMPEQRQTQTDIKSNINCKVLRHVLPLGGVVGNLPADGSLERTRDRIPER